MFTLLISSTKVNLTSSINHPVYSQSTVVSSVLLKKLTMSLILDRVVTLKDSYSSHRVIFLVERRDLNLRTEFLIVNEEGLT